MRVQVQFVYADVSPYFLLFSLRCRSHGYLKADSLWVEGSLPRRAQALAQVYTTAFGVLLRPRRTPLVAAAAHTSAEKNGYPSRQRPVPK